MNENAPWISFWSNFQAILGPILGPKTAPKMIKNIFVWFHLHLKKYSCRLITQGIFALVQR